MHDVGTETASFFVMMIGMASKWRARRAKALSFENIDFSRQGKLFGKNEVKTWLFA